MITISKNISHLSHNLLVKTKRKPRRHKTWILKQKNFVTLLNIMLTSLKDFIIFVSHYIETRQPVLCILQGAVI